MQLRRLEREVADKEQAIRKIREDMKKNKLDQYSRQVLFLSSCTGTYQPLRPFSLQ